MIFSLDQSYRNRCEPCPWCETTDHLVCMQGFGGRIICKKCGHSSAWVPGNEFYSERDGAINKWNSSVTALLKAVDDAPEPPKDMPKEEIEKIIHDLIDDFEFKRYTLESINERMMNQQTIDDV